MIQTGHSLQRYFHKVLEFPRSQTDLVFKGNDRFKQHRNLTIIRILEGIQVEYGTLEPRQEINSRKL